ncbi:MAG TPA: hypothetical protein VEK08_12495 [Planctomycetota bacterium]|nr:hypothetical protein [Planctomycetota bacterium]
MARAKRQKKLKPKDIDRPDRLAMRQERHLPSDTQGSETGEHLPSRLQPDSDGPLPSEASR